MATQLFLTSTASPLGGSGQLALSTTRGSSSTSAITNTTASGTSIPVTATAGGTALTWWYQVGAGTISGNVTANIRGKESNASANAGAGIVVDLYQSDGTTLIGNLLTTTAPATITEYTTSDAAKALASTAATSQKATNGCWIKVTLTVRNVGTMATGFTVTNTYNGTSGAAGDTSVTFATTLPTYVAPNTGMAYVAAAGISASASSPSLSVPVPKGVTTGDLIILALGAEWNSTTLPDSTSVSVSGFTVAQVSAYQSYTNYAEVNILLYKYATGADTGTYSVTFNNVSGGSVTQVAGVASIVRNGPTSGNPFTDTFQSSHSVGSTSLSVASFTPTANNSLLIGSIWCNDTVQVSTYPSGWVNQANTTTGNGMMLSTLQQASPAATGTLAWGMASGTPDPVALIGTIRHTLAPTTITPASMTVQNGTPLSVTLGNDGVPTATYSVTAGALPGGLSLSSGVISGTPTDSGGLAYSFTITATNTIGSTTKTYSGTVAGDPLAPTIVNYYSGATHGNVTSQSVTVQTGDLLIATAYMEPGNEGTSSASYGTITPPSGFTLIPSPAPAASNDAHLTSQSTQRSYIAYMWATSNTTVTVGDWGYGTSWYEFDSIVQFRGATDKNGLTIGSPVQEIAVASQGTTSVNSYPGVSLTTANAHSTLLYVGTNWYANMNNSFTGWLPLSSNGTGAIYVNVQAGAGTTASVAPTTVSSTSLLTSTLISFRKVLIPVAAYSFDEGSGTTIHDMTGNGNDFTLTDTSKWTTGKTNGGLGYGAGTSYATRTLTSDIANASLPFTVMMWVNPANTTQSDTGLIGNTALDLEFDAAGHFYGDGFGTTPSGYSANTWLHVAWVADGTNKITYVNGVNVLSTAGAAPGGWASGASIGLSGTNDTSLFNGVMDDVRIFGSALGVSDINYFMGVPVIDLRSAPTISTTSLNSLAQYTAFTQTLAGSGYPTPTWSVTSGSLPTGLSLTSAGVLSGTPSIGGAYNFTVTATNTSGSVSQTYSGTVTQSRMIRNKTVFQSSGTTITATFAESLPLDSTYLLVAIVSVGSATAIATPSGWTAVSGNGNNTTAQVRMFTKQGDGTTNSVAITVPSASATLTLAGYSGFSSLTPIATDGGSALAQGTSYSGGSVSAGAYTGHGVLIQAVAVTGTVVWNSWTTLTRIGLSTGSTSLASSSQLMTAAYQEFDGAVGTGPIGVTWISSKSGREMGVIMPLTNTIPTEVASYSFDENAGTTATDSSGNSNTATATAWTTGHTNSGVTGDTTHSPTHRSGTIIPTVTGLTFMYWFYPTTSGGDQDINWLTSDSTGGGASGTGEWYSIYWNDSTHLGLGLRSNSGGNVFGGASIATPLSTWVHITMTWDGSTAIMYLNGVIAYSMNSSSFMPSLAWMEAGGAMNTGFGGANMGTVDDVRLYSSALSQWQIVQLMGTPVPAAGGTTPPPIGATWWAYGGQQLTPYTLTSGGLVLLGSSTASRVTATYRWSADSISLSNGSQVTSWTDSVSGAVLSASSGNAPTYTTGALNGKPVLRWPTTDSTVVMQASSLTQISYPFTLMAVVNVADNTSQRELIFWGIEVIINQGASLPLWVLYASDNTYTYTSEGFDVSGAHIVTCIVNQGSSAIYIDGILQATGTVNQSLTDSTLYLGAHPGHSGWNWRGDIAYVALYPTALSSGDRSIEHIALSDEYGITVSDRSPVIVNQTFANASGYGGMYSPSITTGTSTNVGDLVIIVGYVEPYNEGKAGATYGNFTLPTGVTLASGFPIETDAAHVTTGNDHRMYVWYYYATTAGSTTLTFSNDQQIYWGLASVTIHGGPTSGNPFADTPSTATISASASGVTSTPPVSLTLGGPNSLVLWVYTDWNGTNPGYPSGISDVTHASNEAGQPAIGYAYYTAAGSTGTITAVRTSNDQGMAAALLSFRVP